jgi:hypothetical protein
MPTALLIEILSGIVTVTTQWPEVTSLLDDAVSLIRTGSVTPEQEASIRAKLDLMKLQIDRAV